MIEISPNILHIRPSDRQKSCGTLEFGHTHYRCLLGKSGIAARKIEGDNATPVGRFEVLYGFYRADRVPKPATKISMIALKPNAAWCDDPNHRSYNRYVELPFAGRFEHLWRKDNLYDICIVLNHNQHPRKRNAGSAIFFHLASEFENPTQGCVAVNYLQMIHILRRCEPDCALNIQL